MTEKKDGTMVRANIHTATAQTLERLETLVAELNATGTMHISIGAVEKKRTGPASGKATIMLEIGKPKR